MGGSCSWNAHAVWVRSQDVLAPGRRILGRVHGRVRGCGGAAQMFLCVTVIASMTGEQRRWWPQQRSGEFGWLTPNPPPRLCLVRALHGVSLLPSRKNSWDSGLPEDMERPLLPRFLSPPSPALAEPTREASVRRWLWARWVSRVTHSFSREGPRWFERVASGAGGIPRAPLAGSQSPGAAADALEKLQVGSEHLYLDRIPPGGFLRSRPPACPAARRLSSLQNQPRSVHAHVLGARF